MSEAVVETEAEVAKRLGNEAFSSKKFDAAISHYTEAIRLDPENAIYYSNRSACYASKNQWQEAADDAQLCVGKDPKFIKGYYRLATAQIELGNFSDAEITISAALKIDPDNDQLTKLKKTVKSKRLTAVAAAKEKKAPRQLDEAQMKELMELQEQTNTYNRDLRGVQSRIVSLQREFRASQVTSNQISGLDEAVPLYRAVGKAFVLAPREEIEKGIESELEKNTRNQRDLLDRKEFLERRISSNVQNLQELAAGL